MVDAVWRASCQVDPDTMRAPAKNPSAVLGVIIATLLSASLVTVPARAEGWFGEGEVGASTGLEGGDAGDGVIWTRARTRLLGGFELGWTETDTDALGWRFAVEIEKRPSFGGELRYVRRLNDVFAVHAGGSTVLVPDSLYGGTLGGRLVIPMGDVGLFIEPALHTFVAGTDLPKDTVLIWATLSLGVRFEI